MRDDHARQLAQLEAMAQAADAVAALAGDARFRLWIEKVQILATKAEAALLTATDPVAIAREQGRVQALRSILAVTKGAADAGQTLALALREEHDRAAAVGMNRPGPLNPSEGIWSHGRHEQRQQGRSDGGAGQGAPG